MIKKHYICEFSDNPKITGDIYLFQASVNNDQTSKLFMSLEKNVESSIIEPLTCFELNENAIITDFLSMSRMKPGMLISNKLKELITQFTLPKCEFIESLIYFDKSPEKAFWMNLYEEMYNFIDYNKTEFIKSKNSIFDKNTIEKLGFLSKNELINLVKEKDLFDRISPLNGYVFQDDFVTQTDIFRIGLMDQNIYVSERLKDRILQENLSGFRFIEKSLVKPH
ncbi:MAG: hypothetical protein GQ574_10195 [Crocinitomix sp.]|nr:hypothetical protein [Crocinitomix sp.]